MIEAIGLVAAALIGAILGLLGGGGSILALPVFTYLLDVPPKPSIMASLIVVSLASLVGGIRSHRIGDVDLGRGALFVVGSIPGAFLGGLLGRGLDDELQLMLFAIVMLTTAIAMLLRKEADETLDSATIRTSLRRMLGGILAGAVVGIITGIVGAGGGFLIVPALTMLFAVPMRRAIGTSMLVIAVNSIAALVGYLGDGRAIEELRSGAVGDIALPVYVALFSTVMTIGVLLTGHLRSRFDANLLRILFASFLIVLGVTMLILNL